jgi:hypothetical protein
MSSVRSMTKIANTATITPAALVTVPAVRLIPAATAVDPKRARWPVKHDRPETRAG